MPENWEDEPYKQCENVMRTMLQSSDNGLRKEAEATIARAMRDAANARIFCILLRRSEEAGIRQLSAVLLRRQCHLWFRRMKEEDRALCKEYMLSSLMHEPNRLVRLAVGHAVSTLAKAELRRDHWKELLPVLQSLTKQADDPTAMEVAVLIFYELCEVIVDLYGTQSLVDQVILPSMSHTNVAVNVAGLKVVQELMCILQEDSTHRSTIDLLVPRVLEVIEKKLVHERTMIDACIDVLDVVDSFLMLSIKRHREVVQVVSQTMLRIMQDRAVPCALRHRTMMGLITVAEGKPNYFTQSGLLEHSLRAIASLLCEDDSISEVHVYDLEDTEENEENEDDLHDGFSDSNNPCEIATFYLDAICTNVDPRNSMRPLMNIAESLYEDAVHAPCVRKGALFFTAIPCREYFEALRPHTATLMKTAVESGHPSNPFFVRSAALAALAFHVRYLQPDSLSYHAHIVPLLVDAVRDASSVNIQHKVCLTLETFVENLERDVVQPYIDVIVPNLINVIQHERTSMATRHAAISCLSAAMETRTARAYLSAILPVLEHALYLEKDETMALRAEAVEALSVLAIAAGRTDWDPIFPRIFDRIQDGMQRHDFAQLRESTFGFYANMAEVFGADFMVHVPVCLSYILHSIESEDGTVENVHPLAGGGNHVTSSLLELQADESNESEESSSDAGSDLSEAEDLRMRVHRTVIDEKAAAVYALGVLAECVGPPFAQHVPRGLTALRAVQSHFNETVRANAVAAAAKLVVCSHHASMGVVRQDSKARVGWPSHDTLVPDVRALTDLMVTAILSIFRSDESVAVAGAACEALAVLCEGMGSVGVYPHVDALVEELIHLLRHESFCQTHMEDAEDEDEADAGSQGSGKGAGFSLYDSIGECLEALAKSYGPDFWPLSMKIFPCLWPYVNDLTDTNESITTLAVFTTSIAAMQDVAITLCEPFTHLCLNILRTPNVAGGIVRNAAVLFGQLSLTFSIPQVHLLSARELFYEILKRIAETQPPPPSYDGYVIDNCLSTLCIILRQVEALSPETSDIEYIAKCLPLRADYDEAENIYGTLVWVLEKYHKPSTALEAYMGGVVCCLCEMLADEKIPTQIRTVVIHSLQHAGLIHAVQLQDLHLSNAARSALKSLFFC